MKVTKAILPAAGFGTRFLPLTKSVHKEMLPVLNKPLIHFLVEEAIESGIKELIIVISDRKHEIEDYFTLDKDIEKHLKLHNKSDLLDEIKEINKKIKITFVTQEEQLGLGHAIITGASTFKDEPFGVILGDDLIKSEKPVLKQLIEQYEKLNSSIIGVREMETKWLVKYGNVQSNDDINKNTFEITGAVEKPKLEQISTNIAALGRYVFDYKIIDCLKQVHKTQGDEIDVIDGFENMIKSGNKIYAHKFIGKRYDFGTIEDFIEANIDYAIEKNELSKETIKRLKKKLEQ